MKEQKKKSAQLPARPTSNHNVHQEQEYAKVLKEAAGSEKIEQVQNTKLPRENKHKKQISEDWAREGTPSSSSPEVKGKHALNL